MTVGVLDLYRLKLRMFLGPIRRQPAVLAVLVILAVLFLPGAFAFGYFFSETPFATEDLVEIGSFALSAFAAVTLLSAPGGGLLLQPAEVDFVAVAPVTVRRFVLADAMFQCTVFGVGLPGLVVVALGYTLGQGAPVWAFLIPVATLTLLLFLGVLVVQTLGIARLRRKTWAIPVALLLFAVLLAPAVSRVVLQTPIPYAALPFPTTAAVQIALLPFGGGSWTGVPVLAVFAALVLAVHAWSSRVPSLPNVRGTFAFGFNPESRRLQQEAMMRLFGRFRRARSARIHRPALWSTMAAVHRVRMTRDGTLFLCAVMGFALGLPTFIAGAAFSFGGLYVVLFLPIAAVGQWMATDRPNLWIVKVCGGQPQAFFVGWWLVLGTIVAGVGVGISLVGGLAAGRVDVGGIGVALCAAPAATAGAVIASARFPYSPNEFSVRPFLHFLLTGLLGGLGAAPALIATFAFGGAPGFLGALLLGIAVAVGVAGYLLVEWGSRNPAS